MVGVQASLLLVVAERKNNRLNDAFVALCDDDFEDVKTILDLRGDELDSVHGMRPAKRQKLRHLFNILANCDDQLKELAQRALDDDLDEPSVEAAAPSQASNAGYTLADFAKSEKCVCGVAEGKKMVGGKKMVDGKKIVGGKMVGGKMVM